MIRAFLLGIRDGWQQPHEVNYSANVEHLDTGRRDVYEAQDAGINVGQILRAGRRSEAWRMRHIWRKARG